MPVDEQEAGRSGYVAQSREGGEQDRAVGAEDEREPARRERGAHARVEPVEHLEQGMLVEEAGIRRAVRAGVRHGEVRPVQYVSRPERGDETRRAQRCGGSGLPRPPSHAVEGNADQLHDHVPLRPSSAWYQRANRIAIAVHRTIPPPIFMRRPATWWSSREVIQGIGGASS